MARPTMAELIGQVRVLIGDLGGASVFSDDEIEHALDAHREDVRYLELRAAETLTPTGVQYLDYYADRAPWEADEALVNGAWQAVTPASADRLVGKWTFPAHQDPPVYITGKVYDLYATAADLLEAWGARVKLEFDFSADGQAYSRSQKLRALMDLAAEYRRKQRPTTAVQVRADLRPEGLRW